MEKLLVELEEKSYNIVFEKSFDRLCDELSNINCPKKVLIVTDSNVRELYADSVEELLLKNGYDVKTFSFVAGEGSKNINTILDISKACLEHKMDRKSIIIALGGGVVGDMAGFAASIFMRGINFVQIPTTLLSQTDSSVGGKTGIDFMQTKNVLGAFHQPQLVYINSSVLKTLPKREFVSGMGEVIKHAIIRDFNFFEYLEKKQDNVKRLDDEIILDIIRKNCVIKASIVSKDEKETGVRAYLNFGHTFGHAIESCSNFELSHGECVGLGMVAATVIAKMRGLCSCEDLNSIRKILTDYGFSVKTKISDLEEVIKIMQMDKKKAEGKIKFILPVGIGSVTSVSDVNEDEISKALEFIRK